MKRFIFNIVLFLLFMSTFYSVALIIAANLVPQTFKPNLIYPIGGIGFLHTRLSEVKKYAPVDIVFLGSSHAYKGFDTRIFSKNGYKTFNLGSSSQSHIQTKVLINRYLNYLNPKLVIYEVYPPTFEIDGAESALDLIANDKNDKWSIFMSFKINNIKVYNTMLYGILADILNINNSFKESHVKDSEKYIPGGFVEMSIQNYKPLPIIKKNISIKKSQFDEFSEIIELLKKENIKVLLVFAPITKNHYHSYTNKRYFDSLMKSVAPYYNFNEIISLDDSLHFFDSHHLNQNGVVVFNNKLIEILKAN